MEIAPIQASRTPGFARLEVLSTGVSIAEGIYSNQ
jgi:hypothetical protein